MSRVFPRVLAFALGLITSLYHISAVCGEQRSRQIPPFHWLGERTRLTRKPGRSYQREMGFRFCFATVPLLAIQAGCARWLVRAEGAYSSRTEIYPATAIDVGTVYYAATWPFNPHATDPQDGLVYLFLPAAIVDLPLALVVDTVLLPHDFRESSRKASRAQRADEDGAPPPP